MPAIPAGDLTLLRTEPQHSALYLIVQQPQYHDGNGDWAGYFWSCQIDGAPAGTEGDLVASLTVDNGDAGPVELIDGMTVFIGTVKGDHDKGIYRVRVNQTVDGATVALNIGSSSDIIGNVEDDDWVVVLDEFRLWTRYPLITEAAGTLSWYKDYNITYAGLGGTAADRREASLPPVPIMGPHAVAFIPSGGSADIDFDWRDSYAQYEGATVNDWDAEGLDGGAGWTVLNNSNPGDQTYSNVSGLAGYRVQLEIGTDQNDPPARFRRGIRYVFTLRRPGETEAGDPANAEPITDFSLDSLVGDHEQGYWQGQITIYDSQAAETDIIEGALVILFADDWYGSTNQSIAPRLGTTAELDDRENIVFVGRIMDGSVVQNPETGDVTFDVASAAGIATNRDMYPIPIEDDANADEWYKCPDLTVDRAAWFYAVWHSTLPLICDWYSGDGTEPIKAMDFLAGDIYSTLDGFLQERIFGKLLCDRFERCSSEQDRQIKAEASGATMYTLADTDWLEEFSLQDVIEKPVSNVQVGALNYNAGAITPYLGRAPGDVNRDKGSTQSNMAMAMASQATLNTVAGRWLAKLNNRWPELKMFQGNWRIYDVWPQDYVIVNLVTERHTFSSDKFIQRGAEIQYDPIAGAIFVSPLLEAETGGVDGQTVDIPDEPPAYVPPYVPYYPPSGPTVPYNDSGRRMLATNMGVIVTNEIGATSPVWYVVNTGVPSGDIICWKIFRDPWHWWTSGGTERTLWGTFTDTAGTVDRPKYLYKMENFPYGTWALSLNVELLAGILGSNEAIQDVMGTIEVEDKLVAAISGKTGGIDLQDMWWAISTDAGATWTTIAQINTANTGGWWDYEDGMIADIAIANHSASLIAYAEQTYMDANNDGVTRKTFNNGAAWSTPGDDNHNYGFDTHWKITVPYVNADWNDRDVIKWGTDGRGNAADLRKSTDSGVNWTDIAAGTWDDIHAFNVAPGYQNEYAVLTSATQHGGIDRSAIYRSSDGGVTWTTWTTTSFDCSRCALWKWNGATLENCLVFDSSNDQVKLISQHSAADKTGNLQTVAPGTTWARTIERDTMGGA